VAGAADPQFFDHRHVVRLSNPQLDVEFDSSAQAILCDEVQPFESSDFVYVFGKVIYDGKVFDNVGIRINVKNSQSDANVIVEPSPLPSSLADQVAPMFDPRDAILRSESIGVSHPDSL